MDAIAILKRHLAETIAAREFHRKRGTSGNIELAIAGHKIAWLKALLREIDPPKK